MPREISVNGSVLDRGSTGNRHRSDILAQHSVRRERGSSLGLGACGARAFDKCNDGAPGTSCLLKLLKLNMHVLNKPIDLPNLLGLLHAIEEPDQPSSVARLHPFAEG